MLAGYPFASGGRVSGRLALGDLDRDGKLDIVAGVEDSTEGIGARVFAWRANGTTLPGWPQSTACYRSDYTCGVRGLALADIDNDEYLEVIAGTDNNNISNPDPALYVPNLYVWRYNGQLVGGKWPLEDDFNAGILGNVAVGDLTGDGKSDIATGRDDRRLFAFDRQGNNLPGWPIYVYVDANSTVPRSGPQIELGRSGPSLADLDGDGVVEYVIAGLRSTGRDDYYNNDLLVLEPNSARRAGWETPAGGTGLLVPDKTWRMPQLPAVADLNGDRKLDIVLTTQDGWIRAYAANKTLLWSFDYARGQALYASEPVIGDVDGDGLSEVVFGTFDPNYSSTGPVGLWILENNGSPKTGLSSPSLTVPDNTYGIVAAPTLADVDDDGYLEIAAATINRGQIYVWDTPAPYDSARLPWPMSRHDNQRTAFVNQASPRLERATKAASNSVVNQYETITYTLVLAQGVLPLTHTIQVTDVVPAGLSYIAHTLEARYGTADDSQAPVLRWTGLLSDVAQLEIEYAVLVTASSPKAITNIATVDIGSIERRTCSVTVIANGWEHYLPNILRSPMK